MQNGTNPGDGNIEIVLVEIDEYVVTYNGNGHTSGNMEAVSTEVEYDTTILQSSYSKVGYTFTSWNTQSNGHGNIYNPMEIYTEREDLDLYAQWKANEYTVNLYKNTPNDATSSIQ